MDTVKTIILFFFLIIFCGKFALTHEIVEVSCLNNKHCRHFEYKGITAECNDKRCDCTDEFGERRDCKPSDRKLSNIIGGICPCTQPNSECNHEQNICYCAYGYVPSTDKRRCISKAVSLNEPCELDWQCQAKDVNTLCDTKTKTCVCLNTFFNAKGHCRSLIGKNFECKNNAQCEENFGDVSYCGGPKCYCSKGFIVSSNDSICKPAPQYLESCFNDEQCSYNMGPGAVCTDNVCKCSDSYFADHIYSPAICSHVVERGQYCRTDSDCYQRQLDNSNQSLNCIYAECDCKPGFYSLNDGNCQRSDFAAKVVPNVLMLVIFLAKSHFLCNIILR